MVEPNALIDRIAIASLKAAVFLDYLWLCQLEALFEKSYEIYDGSRCDWEFGFGQNQWYYRLSLQTGGSARWFE